MVVNRPHRRVLPLVNRWVYRSPGVSLWKVPLFLGRSGLISNGISIGSAVFAGLTVKNVCRILVRWVTAPMPPEAKILKIWLRRVYSEVLKNAFFACFCLLIFHPFFLEGVSWPHLPLCADARAHGRDQETQTTLLRLTTFSSFVCSTAWDEYSWNEVNVK